MALKSNLLVVCGAAGSMSMRHSLRLLTLPAHDRICRPHKPMILCRSCWLLSRSGSAAFASAGFDAAHNSFGSWTFNTIVSFECTVSAGLERPDGKAYIRPAPAPALPPLLFLAVRALLPAYRLEAAASCFLERRPGRAAPDPAALAAGMAALLQQFPAAYLQVQCLPCPEQVTPAGKQSSGVVMSEFTSPRPATAS